MDSIISGNSRGSRPILRTQPQLRLDCSPARIPFSQSATETPRSARNRAVLIPDDAAADDDDIDGARRTHIGLASIEGGPE